LVAPLVQGDQHSPGLYVDASLAEGRRNIRNEALPDAID
jgi:hypothetical protein